MLVDSEDAGSVRVVNDDRNRFRLVGLFLEGGQIDDLVIGTDESVIGVCAACVRGRGSRPLQEARWHWYWRQGSMQC